MMVRVEMKVIMEPIAPRIPKRLFQKPQNNSAQISHSEAPRNLAAPRKPKAGYNQNMNGPWWALPPLQLTARYYPDAVPTDVLAAISNHCPWTLRHAVRHRRLSDVSLSYPWIEAFPGIAWSRSCAEIVEYIGGRIWPDKEMRRLRDIRVETDVAMSETQWGRLSQRRRMLRWLTSRPLRGETLHAVRMALSETH